MSIDPNRMLLAKVVQSRIKYLFKQVDNRIDESKKVTEY